MFPPHFIFLCRDFIYTERLCVAAVWIFSIIGVVDATENGDFNVGNTVYKVTKFS
jgi:hypothetical protein